MTTRIVMLSTNLARGGAETQVVELARGLGQQAPLLVPVGVQHRGDAALCAPQVSADRHVLDHRHRAHQVHVLERAGDAATRDVALRRALDALADVAVKLNASVENIGARRLQTVMERVLDEISFVAPDKSGEKLTIDAEYVRKHVGDLAANTDLSRYIL